MVLAVLPLLVIAGLFVQKYQLALYLEEDTDTEMSRAVGTVSEAIKAIKVVQAFGIQVSWAFPFQTCWPLVSSRRSLTEPRP